MPNKQPTQPSQPAPTQTVSPQPTQPVKKSGGACKWILIILIILIILVALVLAGCWLLGRKAVKEIEKQGVKIGEEGVKVETKEGEYGLGGVKLPEGFPSEMPIYPDTKITFSSSNKEKGEYNVVLSTKENTDQVASWYKDRLTDDWEITSTTNIGGVTGYSISGKNYQGSVSIWGGEDTSTISISLQKKTD